MYYLNRTLITYELNYPQIEKAYLAVVLTFQKIFITY